MKHPLVTLPLATLMIAVQLAAQTPSRAVESSAGFAPIAPLVEAAIARHELPGAVVLVGRGDEIVFHQAFGQRAIRPTPEPMTEATIFDLASLTKVVATTTSVMKLMEEGRIRLTDPVALFIPEFGRFGKGTITIRDLLTHTSGLRPDLELEVEFHGAAEAIRRASDEVPVTPPGQRFVYSDINFFLLGDIVRRVSGETLDRYSRTRIFEPLGMHETSFLPPESWRPRIAPTEA
ncbi:MAG: serine hydrolase domain-containing protein, partial [Vicinamibacterales bacterium]